MTVDQVVGGIEVRLFGGPNVMGPDGPIRLSPFQLALLTLVFAEAGISRPRIASILWQKDDDARIRHRIRQLLHQVNARLGVRAIEPNGDRLAPSGAVRSDLARFRASLRSNQLLEAASIADPGFATHPLSSVRGTYRDWAESVGQQLTSKLTERAVARWQEMAHGGSWTEARDAAECLYLLRPTDPRVVEHVIEARARAGRIGSAEAAYATYVESLSGGEHPARGVQDGIERVRTLQASDDRAARAKSGPFVGREEALASGTAALDRVEAGGFAVYLVSGESGIGKTRLLGEIEREAVLRDFRCLRASPVELESRIPLNPLLDSFRETDLKPHLKTLGTPWSTVIRSTLPPGSYDEVVGELPPIQESSLPRRLLDAFSMLLEQLALEKPTVLFLDDLQWADATTVAALQFFQRRWSKGAFGIIASVRRDLVGPSDPAAKYLEGQDGLDVVSTELGELSEGEAVRLIEGISEGEIGDASVKRLCELAGLHPLYLTELTRDFLSGRLKLPDLPVDEVPIPVSLKQIFRSRIDRLSDHATRIAGLLAVGARAMRLGDVATLSGIGLDKCTDCVDELERARLVEVQRDAVRISHDLFRSAIYNHLSEARRAVLHRAIAEHLLADDSEIASGELAIHFARAGEAELAAQYGWTAAARAWENGAMAEAAYFYELVTENEGDSGRRAEATAGMGRSLHLNRDIDRANPVLELAAERLREAGRFALARRMEVRRVDGLAEGDAIPMAQLVERLSRIKLEARGAQDWEAVAFALDVEVKLLRLTGHTDEVRALYPQLRQVAGNGRSTAARVIGLGAVAIGVCFDNPGEAVRSAQEAVVLTAGAPGDQRLQALNRLFAVLCYRGELELSENKPLVEEARALAESCGDLQQRFSLQSNLGTHAMDSGDLDKAAVLFETAGKMLGRSDATFLRVNLAMNLGELALSYGDFGVAAQRYRDASEHVGNGVPQYARDTVSAGLGLCSLETGSLAEARRKEAELGPPPSQPWFDPSLQLAFRSRLMERRGQCSAAADLLARGADEIEGRLVLAWLKVRELQTTLMIRGGLAGAEAVALPALECANRLRLPHRADRLRNLLDRIG